MRFLSWSPTLIAENQRNQIKNKLWHKSLKQKFIKKKEYQIDQVLPHQLLDLSGKSVSENWTNMYRVTHSYTQTKWVKLTPKFRETSQHCKSSLERCSSISAKSFLHIFLESLHCCLFSSKDNNQFPELFLTNLITENILNYFSDTKSDKAVFAAY